MTCGPVTCDGTNKIQLSVYRRSKAMRTTVPFQMRRLGTIMRGDPGNPDEVLGVLNPATARAPDGKLYLFPRIVAAGNYSRVGIAEVVFDTNGDPTGVERRGYAL